MKYIVDKNSAVKAYMQIYDQIRKDIIDGTYKLQDKLPSKRQLALDTGTSVITVEHAYAILIDEGYIEARERSGYRVIYQDKDWMTTHDTNNIEIPDIHPTNLHDTISFNVLSKTMRKVLNEYQEEILSRSPNQGCMKLKVSIANYLRKHRGMDVEPNQIIIGSGAEYLYGMIVQMLGNERIYALEDPSYEKIKKVYQSHNVSIEMLVMASDGILTSELHNSHASVLHVTPYHSFPSGISASISKRKEYVHFARSRNGYVIEDDFDSEFSVNTKVVDTIYSLEPYNSVIYINSFTKTIAPSIRVGYMVLPKNKTQELLEKIHFYSCTVPTFEQYVIAELLDSGTLERHINRIRRQRRKQMKNT